MCAVTCCKNNLKATKALSSDVSFHTFPKDNEPQRLKTWISKIKRQLKKSGKFKKPKYIVYKEYLFYNN